MRHPPSLSLPAGRAVGSSVDRENGRVPELRATPKSLFTLALGASFVPTAWILRQQTNGMFQSATRQTNRATAAMTSNTIARGE